MNEIPQFDETLICPVIKLARKVCGNIKCEPCYHKSFASHPTSKFWNKLNNYKPHELYKGSSKIIAFDCQKCPHIYRTELGNANRGIGCNYCANKILCGDEKCKLCFKKSLASDEQKSKYFLSERNGINANVVFKTSKIIYWFYCEVCKQPFKEATRYAHPERCDNCRKKYIKMSDGQWELREDVYNFR